MVALVQSLSHVWLFGTPRTAPLQVLCPPLAPGVCSSSWPLSRRWCLAISSSAAPFSFGLQSFPASGSFPVSQLFLSGGQSIRASASASVSEYKGSIIWALTGLTSLQSDRLSRVFSSTTLGKHQFFGAQPSLWFSFYSSVIHMGVLKLEMHSSPNEMSCMCKRHGGFRRQYKVLVGLTNNTLYLTTCLSNIIWTQMFKNIFLIATPLVPFSFLTRL